MEVITLACLGMDLTLNLISVSYPDLEPENKFSQTFTFLYVNRNNNGNNNANFLGFM